MHSVPHTQHGEVSVKKWWVKCGSEMSFEVSSKPPFVEEFPYKVLCLV